MPSFIFGCLIWIPLMFWVLSLVGWMITGDIDWVTGCIGIVVGLLLGGVAVVPPVPILSSISFFVVVCTMVLYPFARSGMERRELRSLDVHQVERTYESLGQRPLNPSARFKLAQHLWTLGMPGVSVSIADSVLPQMPVQLFRDEHRIAAAWKQHPLPPNAFDPVPCPDCGKPNPPSEVFCVGCGAPYLLHRVKRKAGPNGIGKRLVAAWVALVAILAGIPAATALPPLLTGLSVLLLLTAAGLVLWLAFRPMLEAA